MQERNVGDPARDRGLVLPTHRSTFCSCRWCAHGMSVSELAAGTSVYVLFLPLVRSWHERFGTRSRQILYSIYRDMVHVKTTWHRHCLQVRACREVHLPAARTLAVWM